MAIWEYKVISSGRGGFATPQLLENFLNQLGKDEWEIVSYRPAPENQLAFSGLARRTTQREWTLEAAAAAQAKIDEERRRVEERIEQAARDAASERAAAVARGETPAPVADAADKSGPEGRDERLRTYRDTDLDNDPDALAEEAAAPELGDWDEMAMDDDLPTLFDAIKPHLRRNQKGPGEAAALDYLAKRWDQETDDVLGALKECGFTVPKTEDEAPDYFEFEGDLFWLNCNNRGQIFINVREKPRPRFKPTTVRKLDPEDPASVELRAEYDAEQDKKRQQREEQAAREAEREAARAARQAAAEAQAAKPPPGLPEGLALLDVLVPKMRRNRRGPGMSGTVGFMAKALKRTEAELLEALAGIGLTAVEDANGKPAFLEAGNQLFWLKNDGRGGVWINSRDKEKNRNRANQADEGSKSDEAVGTADASNAEKDADVDRGAAAVSEDQGESQPDASGAPTDAVSTAVQAPAPIPAEPIVDKEAVVAPVTFTPGAKALPALRLLLKPKSRGVGASAEIGSLARTLDKAAVEILEALVRAGLNVPDNADEKPVFVELGDEILWINRNPKDESLWLNAKEKPKRRSGGGRSRSRSARSSDGTAEGSGAGDSDAGDGSEAPKRAAGEVSSETPPPLPPAATSES